MKVVGLARNAGVYPEGNTLAHSLEWLHNVAEISYFADSTITSNKSQNLSIEEHWNKSRAESLFTKSIQIYRIHKDVFPISGRTGKAEWRLSLAALSQAVLCFRKTEFNRRLLNLFSVVSDPLVVISENGAIRFVNDAMLELLRISGNRRDDDNVSYYVSADTFATLIEDGIPTARKEIYRAPIELIDARHQTHHTEARLVDLGENKNFPDCFALLLDERSFVVRKAYGLDVAEIPHRVRVRDHGASLVIKINGDGSILSASDSAGDMIGYSQSSETGQVLWSLECWSDPTEFEVELKRCIESLDSYEKQFMPARLRQNDGATVWLELSISRTTDGVYVVEGYDVTSRVVTEMGQRQYTKRLAHLSRQLLTAQESERRRIAQELHDQIGQLLTALRLGLHSVRHSMEDEDIKSRLDVSLDTVDKVLGHVRSLSLDLRPAMLDDLGLPAALNWFGARQSELTGLNVEVFADRLEHRLPNTVEVACFRIVQEAVSNAMRHSQSEEIHISMHLRGNSLELDVEDFGIGFDSRKVLDNSVNHDGLGLENIQQRAALVDGEFKVDSVEGRGSRVRVRIPII